MTATEELRKLLNERGIEWYDGGERLTTIPAQDRVLQAWIVNIWPSGKAMGDCLWVQNCHPFTPAEVLSVTLGCGECRNVSYRLDESRFHCSECGFGCWIKDVADGRDKLPQYCPQCGRKVER